MKTEPGIVGDDFLERMLSLSGTRRYYRERGEIAGIMLRNGITRGSPGMGGIRQEPVANMEEGERDEIAQRRDVQ